MDNMGERIKMMRTKHGMTQEELGKILGVQRAAVNKYEKGTVDNIKRSTIQTMADVFDVSPAWLIFGDEESIDVLFDKLGNVGKARLIEYAKMLVNGGY